MELSTNNNSILIDEADFENRLKRTEFSLFLYPPNTEKEMQFFSQIYKPLDNTILNSLADLNLGRDYREVYTKLSKNGFFTEQPFKLIMSLVKENADRYGNINDLQKLRDDCCSDITMDFIKEDLNNSIDKSDLTKSDSQILKDNVDNLISNIQKEIISGFEKTYSKIDKFNKLYTRWENAFENKQYLKMSKLAFDIKQSIRDIIPESNIVKKSNYVENIQSLIKNKGMTKDTISEYEIALAKKLY